MHMSYCLQLITNLRIERTDFKSHRSEKLQFKVICFTTNFQTVFKKVSNIDKHYCLNEFFRIMFSIKESDYYWFQIGIYI